MLGGGVREAFTRHRFRVPARIIRGMKYVPIPIAASAFLLIGAHPAFAAAADGTGDEIEEIVVAAQSVEDTIPLELRKYGNRLQILSSAEIEFGGFDDLGQTLQMEVPGLYLAPRSGAFGYMQCSLQGSRCEDILWLIDGVRINNRLYNTTGPLDTVPASIVERVEVLYGGQGIFYGTQSVAGVVNVVTRRFSEDPGGSLEIGASRFEGYHVSGDYRTSLGANQWVFYGSADRSDGFRPFPDHDYQASATDRARGYDVLTAGAKFARRFGSGSRLTLHYQKTVNEVDNLRPYETASANNARDEDLVVARWDQQVGESVDFYVKAYYHDWDTEWDRIVNNLDASGNLTGTQTVLFKDAFWGFEDYGVNASARIESGGPFEYAIGYDYQRFRGTDEVWRIQDETESAHALYAQVRTSDDLFEDTDMALGVRYNTTSGSADATVWNASGKHAFTDGVYVRASLGTSFRLPDAEELYLKDCCEAGNPDLEAENSRNLEIAIGGTAASAAGLRWELIGFARAVDNLIAVDFDNPAFPLGRYGNSGNTVEFSGWEAFVSLAVLPGLDLTLDYVDTRAEPRGSDTQLPEIPESTAKIGLDYRPEQAPFEAGLSVLAVGDVAGEVGSGFGRVHYGNHTVVDLSAGVFLDADGRHRIGFRLENALDETYATSLRQGFRDADGAPYVFRYLGMPRSLHVSYRFTF